MRLSRAAALLVPLLLLAPARSHAQDEHPWAKGISAEEQKTALALFRDGNAALKEGVFTVAATRYRDALSHWDHPAIHYNLVLALRTLDQPLEMREHLLASMRFGAEPLDAAKFENAKMLLELVEKQLARVRVRCPEAGAQVVMDGKQLFTAPGSYDDFVRPGPHTIVATKPGFLTSQLSRPLPGGELSEFDLKLFKASDLTKYRRRWDQWIPWTVLAAGVAVGAAGGGLHYGAKVSFNQFDDMVTKAGGSPATAELNSKRSQGNAMQGVAIGCYAVGGAALVTGAVLVYLNRLQPYQDTAPSSEPKKLVEHVSLAPMLGNAQGVTALVRF